MFVSIFFSDVRLATDVDERSRDTKQEGEASITKWIRKDFDADGYFLLQRIHDSRTDYFLTADNASSLTIKGTCIVYVKERILLNPNGNTKT